MFVFDRAEVVQYIDQVEVVEAILEEYAEISAELAACTDSTNRVVEEIACPASQILLKQCKYFLKRQQAFK